MTEQATAIDGVIRDLVSDFPGTVVRVDKNPSMALLRIHRGGLAWVVCVSRADDPVGCRDCGAADRELIHETCAACATSLAWRSSREEFAETVAQNREVDRWLPRAASVVSAVAEYEDCHPDGAPCFGHVLAAMIRTVDAS